MQYFGIYGQHIYYRLASPAVAALLRSLQDVAGEALADVREWQARGYPVEAGS